MIARSPLGGCHTATTASRCCSNFENSITGLMSSAEKDRDRIAFSLFPWSQVWMLSENRRQFA